MIAIATTLFLAIKAHSLWIYLADAAETKLSAADLFIWFTVWWGLKPSDYFKRSPQAATGDNRSAWAFAILKTGIGASLLFGVAPRLLDSESSVLGIPSQILGGWVGMIGIVFCMHFGYSHLSALWLQSKGHPVKPIMNAPILANTVSSFWGKRWNLAFRDYAHVTLFSPLSRRLGVMGGSIAGFVFSGVIHELAISVPARGGYGWPMLYFLIQSMGVLIERKMQKAKWISSGDWLNRIWTIAVVALPAPMLFHQPFVLKVIDPIVQWCNVSTWVG